ncbi:MAG: NfeD family protein [Planctomycetota bacterium]
MEASFPATRNDAQRAHGLRAWIVALAWLAATCFASSTPLLARAQVDADKPLVQPAAAEVVHMKISGPLDKGTQSLLRRAIGRAKSGPRTLVIELDTPGGEIDLMFMLASQLADANKDGVLTIAWINDKAYSAGALVALACQRIYMRTQGVIGAASPVMVVGGVIQPMDPSTEAKHSAALRSAFRAYAETQHRPAALAEAMVDRMVGAKQVRTRDGELRIVTVGEYDELREADSGVQFVRTIAERGTLVALSGTEAVLFGLADGIADSQDAVLAMVGMGGATLVPIERARSEDLATWLSAVNTILIGIGVMALIAEFKAPGFGLAGGVAIVCFALALFGSYLVGLADVPHLVAVGLGLALVAVELFLMPGAIWPGAIGAILVVGGLAFAQMGSGFFSSPLGREIALDSALELMAGIVVAIGLGALISRYLPHTPLVGRLVQGPTPAFAGGAPAREFVRAPELGEQGVALTPLRPVGKVRFSTHGDEVEARSSGLAIDAGTSVRVVTVEGLRAVVEPDAEGRA